MTLNAYSVFCRETGPQEGAVLVFARTAKDARKMAFPTLKDWMDLEWIEVAARRLDAATGWLAAQEEVDLHGKPQLIENPMSCDRCELWGEPISDAGMCESCDD